MKVIETAQIPSKQFEGAIWSKEQYLDTARGHYLSALAGLSGGKQEQTKNSRSSDSALLLKDYARNQAAEAERASAPGQQGQAHNLSDMDLQMRLPNGVLKACEKDFKAVKLQLDKTLARNTKCQITEMFCKLGGFGKEMEMKMNDATELDTTRIVSSEPDVAKVPLPKTVVESSSIHRMVESLKAELETLKKEHAGLNEIDAGTERAARNSHCRLPKTKSENGGCLSKRDRSRQIPEEVTRDKDEVNDLNIKARGLKREHDGTKVSTNVEKRPRIALEVDEAKEGAVSTLNQAKNFPEGILSAYVSTSESSARFMISEDEHESSSQQVQKSTKLEGAALVEAMEGVEGEKCVDTPEFSIRDFVFSARNKDISLNWPFSQKNLQLCLQHGVKNVLPPFQPTVFLKESPMKRCLADKSLHSEESTFEVKASKKHHLVPGTMLEQDHSWDQELAEGFRDSISLPIGGERDLAYKSIATANSHSEVESVSTSNLPLSEVSDEREAAASAANNKTKSSASQPSNKKCKVAIKMRIHNSRNTPEDITSACTAPPEVISTKICPVCETFSSSSNTTLNAHIDQCLSSQSPPIWVKSSKLVKPRIKPRKMRLMSDICATALSCTLEDLDRRNGTNWATNVDFPLEDADVPAEESSPRVSSRCINNVDDGSVYIDSSGTKIRILSKLNDTPSFSKARESVRPKKQSKKGMRSKFLSPNRKKHLTKHLKYLKATHQRKIYSSLKVKGCSTEARGAEEAILAVGSRHIEKHQSTSYVKELKARKPSHPGVEGIASQSIPLKSSDTLQQNNSEVPAELSRNEIQAEKASLIGNDQVGNLQVEPRGTPAKMHLNLPKRSLSSMQSNIKTPAIYPVELDQRSRGSYRGNTDGPLLRSAVRANRVVCQVSSKMGAGGSTKEGTLKSSNSITRFPSSPEGEVVRQQNALQNADPAISCSRKLLHSSHIGSSKGMRSCNSKRNILSSIHSCVHEGKANSVKTGMAFETSCNRSGDIETEAWSADTRVGYPKSSIITDSLQRSNSDKVRQKQASKHPDGPKGTNGSDDTDDIHGNHGCSYFLSGLHDERDIMASVSSSNLAVGVNETDLRSALDPELKIVSDMSSQIEPLQQAPFSRAETRGTMGDPCLSDEREMFYQNVADAERSELQSGDEALDFGRGSLFPEVDPITIPGPPGSDLPCFSDMGSDDRGSLSSCLARPSGDVDDVVDRDLLEAPSFSTSTNLGTYRKDDLTANEQESLRASLLVPDGYSGWLGACSGPLSTLSSQFTAADVERVTCVNSSENGMINLGVGSAMLNCDYRQCCSQQEEITHSTINSEEGWRPTSSRRKHGYAGLGGQVNNPNDGPTVFSSSSYHKLETFQESSAQAADPFLRTGEYDSSPSAPILRLMGKDLMVSNKVDTDLSRSQAATNVDINMVRQCWELQPPQNLTCREPLLHGQDPHCLPVRHLDIRSSNVIHSFGSYDQASWGMHNYDGMHASFSVLGAGPLQR